jgi:hypothetical protein
MQNPGYESCLTVAILHGLSDLEVDGASRLLDLAHLPQHLPK